MAGRSKVPLVRRVILLLFWLADWAQLALGFVGDFDSAESCA
jgi:hypothetical protein